MINPIKLFELDQVTYTKIQLPLTEAVPQRRDDNYIARNDRQWNAKNIFCTVIYDPLKTLMRDSMNVLVDTKCKELLAGKILDAKARKKCKK
jgi:hypothetical protein